LFPLTTGNAPDVHPCGLVHGFIGRSMSRATRGRDAWLLYIARGGHITRGILHIARHDIARYRRNKKTPSNSTVAGSK